jgi:hypothetical protein
MNIPVTPTLPMITYLRHVAAAVDAWIARGQYRIPVLRKSGFFIPDNEFGDDELLTIRLNLEWLKDAIRVEQERERIAAICRDVCTSPKKKTRRA